MRLPILLVAILFISACSEPEPVTDVERIRNKGELVVITYNGPTTYYEGRDGKAGLALFDRQGADLVLVDLNPDVFDAARLFAADNHGVLDDPRAEVVVDVSDDGAGLDLETGDGVLDFEVRAGRLLSGRLDLPVGTDGFLKGDFRIADLARGVASPVEGSLEARTRDVDVLAVVLPDTQDASGKLDVDVTIGGTLDAPAVLGVAVLEDAAATYFPLGLSLSGVNLRADFDENGHVDLEGSFRAGEGRGEIRTTTRSSNGEAAGIHVGIRGSDLAVIDLPDVSAVADADLRLDYRDRRLDVNGTLDIPRARVRPVNLATSRVDESEDVVIVSGSLPDAGVKEEKPAATEPEEAAAEEAPAEEEKPEAAEPEEAPADEEYARIRRYLESRGTPIGPNDLLIAAQALALDCCVVTANDREFSRVPGLKVENWLGRAST